MKPTCQMCSRERTVADAAHPMDAYDYSPLQVVTGQVQYVEARTEYGVREESGMAWPYRRSWVEKAWAEWDRGEVTRIVMLLPANRTEQGWWQDLVEQRRDRIGSDLRVEFLRGRMRFDRPDWTPGPKGDRPPFGCCLVIWQERP